MKNKKLIIISAAVLAVLVAAVSIILITAKPDTQTGSKAIEVTIVHGNNSKKVCDIKTDAEFLGEAVYSEKLVIEEEYKAGFYTVIDGETADFNKDGAWWCVTKDGEMTNVGMNELPIADGDKFEITYTIS